METTALILSGNGHSRVGYIAKAELTDLKNRGVRDDSMFVDPSTWKNGVEWTEMKKAGKGAFRVWGASEGSGFGLVAFEISIRQLSSNVKKAIGYIWDSGVSLCQRYAFGTCQCFGDLSSPGDWIKSPRG